MRVFNVELLSLLSVVGTVSLPIELNSDPITLEILFVLSSLFDSLDMEESEGGGLDSRMGLILGILTHLIIVIYNSIL